MASVAEEASESGGRRALIVLALAVLALVAALVAAVGPANREDAEYAWPPEVAASSSAPPLGWYAPLPLLNRVPASLDVELPCDLSPPLRAGERTTVLATTRRGDPSALSVTLERGTLRVAIGERSLATREWPESCPLRLEVRGGDLHLPGERVPLASGTTPDGMPVVSGLFTELDLRSGERPEVSLRTRTYATSWTTRQFAAGLLAAVLACLVYSLLALGGRSRTGGLRGALARARAARTATDAVVVGALLVWWIVAPSIWDDGWIRAQQRSLADIGTVGFYYDHWGARLPVGHWFDSLRSAVTGSSHELVLLRIPTLLAVLAAWLGCRWAFGSSAADARAPARWALAAVFLVGAGAWAMTLRPEPFVALLTVVTLGAMLAFQREPRASALVVASLVPAVAVTLHTTGIVAAAPVLAGAPAIWRWLRGRREVIAVVSLAAAGLAVAVVLGSTGGDISTRLADTRLARTSELHTRAFWEEYLRYEAFLDGGAATPLRRLSLAFLVLAVLGLLTRRRAFRSGVSVLPARAVALGLVLLAFLPSKWEWHVGALFAMGAVAVASEVSRMLREGVAGWSSRIRAAVALAAILEASYWAWLGRANIGPFDLQARDWSEGFNPLTWGIAVVVVAAALVSVGRLRGARRLDSLPGAAAWAVVVVSFAALATTAAVLAADTASARWSPPRDNARALLDRETCGVTGVLDAEPGVIRRLRRSDVPTLVVPPVAPYFSCATYPRLPGGFVEIPELLVLQSTAWPLTERDSPFAAVTDLYEVRRAATGPRAIGVYAVEDDIPYARVDAVRDDTD